MQWARTQRFKAGSPLGSRSCSVLFFFLITGVALLLGSCRKHDAASFLSTNQALVTCTLGNVSVVIVPCSAVWPLACAQKYHGAAAATFVSASSLRGDLFTQMGLMIKCLGVCMKKTRTRTRKSAVQIRNCTRNPRISAPNPPRCHPYLGVKFCQFCP